MNDTDELLSIAMMGIDAESFMLSPLGKFMTKKADDEIASATNELIDADPDDVKRNTELRNRIHVSKMFLVWLRDSVSIGHAAHSQIQELESFDRGIT